MFITKRNIVLNIILSLVTCGLWFFVWEVQLADDVKEASKDESLPSGIIVLLLAFITCGIYSLYWLYKVASSMELAKARYNVPRNYNENKGLVYIILSLFGFGIVAFALIQNDLNAIADKNLENLGNIVE